MSTNFYFYFYDSLQSRRHRNVNIFDFNQIETLNELNNTEENILRVTENRNNLNRNSNLNSNQNSNQNSNLNPDNQNLNRNINLNSDNQRQSRRSRRQNQNLMLSDNQQDEIDNRNSASLLLLDTNNESLNENSNDNSNDNLNDNLNTNEGNSGEDLMTETRLAETMSADPLIIQPRQQIQSTEIRYTYTPPLDRLESREFESISSVESLSTNNLQNTMSEINYYTEIGIESDVEDLQESNSQINNTENQRLLCSNESLNDFKIIGNTESEGSLCFKELENQNNKMYKSLHSQQDQDCYVWERFGKNYNPQYFQSADCLKFPLFFLNLLLNTFLVMKMID